MCITEEIKSFIEEKGIKQSYIADRTGIKRDALCTSLQGKRKLPVDEYQKICIALEVPFGFFMEKKSKI